MPYDRQSYIREIRDNRMDRASEIIDLIPDVKPRVAMRALRQAVENGTHGAGELSVEDRQLAFRDGWVKTTSPVGAHILVALYRDGQIKQNPPRTDDISALETYAAGEDAFRKDIEDRIAAHDAYEARLDEIAADPDVARPEEITPDLINKVFIRARGLGAYGEMMIGGLACHKDVSRGQLTNSGKRRHPDEIYCWWIDGSGERRGQDAPERILNRRNDPERNWGLGRE